MEVNFSVHSLVIYELSNLGRDAMAVDLPVRPHVAQKSPLFRFRQRLPNLERNRPQTIDHYSPVNPLLLCLAYLSKD